MFYLFCMHFVSRQEDVRDLKEIELRIMPECPTLTPVKNQLSYPMFSLLLTCIYRIRD